MADSAVVMSSQLRLIFSWRKCAVVAQKEFVKANSHFSCKLSED